MIYLPGQKNVESNLVGYNLRKGEKFRFYLLVRTLLRN